MRSRRRCLSRSGRRRSAWPSGLAKRAGAVAANHVQRLDEDRIYRRIGKFIVSFQWLENRIMLCELNRFMWWLNQNAGAVQALTAALTAIVAILSIGLSIRSLSITNNSLTAMKSQTALWQSELELTRKQFQVAYLPLISVVAMFSRTHPLKVLFKYENLGPQPYRIRSFSIFIRSDMGVFERRVDSLSGRVLPVRPVNGQPLEGQFDVPRDVWSAGLSSLEPPEQDLRISWELMVDDVAGILSFYCEFNTTDGFRVRVLPEDHHE